MRNIFVAFFVLVTFLSIPTFAQENDLPEYGDIADLKNLQKVYVFAHLTTSRNLIIYELKKHPALLVVNSPGEAEFFFRVPCDRKVSRRLLSSNRIRDGCLYFKGQDSENIMVRK